MATRYQLMLLVVWVLAIFYPTQFADVSLLDDSGALASILTQEHFSLKEMFLPHSEGGGYYRPFIPLSYWIDKELWFLAAQNLHLESILGHLLNSILLFFSARTALRLCGVSQENYLPLAVASLFAVHPIVTESVNWISGRTDIIMGNFVLLSLLCILRSRLNGSRLLFGAGLVSAVVAMLAKESAFGFIIALPLILYYKPASSFSVTSRGQECSFRPLPFLGTCAIAVIVALYTGLYGAVLASGAAYLGYLLYQEHASGIPWQRSVAAVRMFFLLPMFVVAVLSLFAIRNAVFSSSTGKIGHTIVLMTSELNYTISLFLGAIGFYVKKFVLPLPLNFFILEINPLYDLLGILLFLGIIYLLTRWELAAIFVLTGFLLLAPALPFAFGTIAWCGYAERYIYLSSAFWILAGGLALQRLLDVYPQLLRTVRYVFMILCLTAGAITFSRNIVWQRNVSLMKDTVAQTPAMRKLHDMYIRALLNAGMATEAEKEYKYALVVAPAGDSDTSDLAMGGELVRQKRYHDALALYQTALNRVRFNSEGLLTSAIDLLRTMQHQTAQKDETRQQLHVRERDYVDRRAIITQNPHYLLEKGKDLSAAGSFGEAFILFDKALKNTSQRDQRLRSTLEDLKHESEGRR